MADDWSGLFMAAFGQSKSAMVLVDGRRAIVDVNGSLLNLLGHARRELIGRPLYELVADGPIATAAEWSAALAQGRFTGTARLVCAGGDTVAVEWGAHAEVVTGGRLVLFVALSTSRWGRRFKQARDADDEHLALSPRQREIVRLVALGHSGTEIADELQISDETVRSHVRAAMARLGARSRAHLVAKAMGEGQL